MTGFSPLLPDKISTAGIGSGMSDTLNPNSLANTSAAAKSSRSSVGPVGNNSLQHRQKLLHLVLLLVAGFRLDVQNPRSWSTYYKRIFVESLLNCSECGASKS